MKRPFHTLLFAAYPVLSLYAANTSLFPPDDLWVPLGIVVGATAILFAIFWLIVRSWDRAAAGASVAAIGVFSYGPISDVVRSARPRESMMHSDLFWSWCAGFAILLVAALWKWKRGPVFTQALNVGGIVLTVVPALTIANAWLHGSHVKLASASTRAAKYSGPRPDIFYIILDGYGRSDVLKREMGFDNSFFIEGLKQRGFYVAEESNANYCQTELSLSSSLNMGYLPDLVPGFSPDSEDRNVFDSLIDRNQVSQTLRDYGYGYIAVGSGFSAFDPRSADLLIDTRLGGSLFETALLQRIPMPVASGVTDSQYVMRRETLYEVMNTVAGLGRRSSRPRFILTHVLAPHPPFVLGPNEEPIQPKRMYTIVDASHFMQVGGTPDEYAKGYAGQAEAISKMMLRAIDQLLKNAKNPPIIVLQGDHGPKMKMDQEELAKTDVNEVFPILNAYYVPDKVREKLYPTITPVNSFRTILRETFGEDLPNVADQNWYSPWTWPFRFTEVTERLQ